MAKSIKIKFSCDCNTSWRAGILVAHLPGCQVLVKRRLDMAKIRLNRKPSNHDIGLIAPYDRLDYFREVRSDRAFSSMRRQIGAVYREVRTRQDGSIIKGRV